MTWDSSVPQGTAAANTIDTVIQSLKTDLNTALTANNASLGDAGTFPGGTEPVANPKYHYRGFRGTSAQKAALAANESGFFFDTDEGQLYSYAGAAWNPVGTLGESVIPAGTNMVFYEATAPTGWTLNNTADDRFLRVETSGGGSTGGSWDDLSHTHNLSDAAWAQYHVGTVSTTANFNMVSGVTSWGGNRQSTPQSGNNSTTSGNDKGLELDGATDNANITHGSAQHQYANIIICTKDAY